MNEIVQVNALELHTANIKEDHKNLPLEGVNTRRVILANGLAFLAASGTHYATRHRKAKNNDQRNRHNHQLLSVKLVIMLTTAETIRTSSSNSHKSQKDKKKEKYRLKQKLKKQNNASHHSPASPASPKSSSKNTHPDPIESNSALNAASSKHDETVESSSANEEKTDYGISHTHHDDDSELITPTKDREETVMPVESVNSKSPKGSESTRTVQSDDSTNDITIDQEEEVDAGLARDAGLVPNVVADRVDDATTRRKDVQEPSVVQMVSETELAGRVIHSLREIDEKDKEQESVPAIVTEAIQERLQTTSAYGNPSEAPSSLFTYMTAAATILGVIGIGLFLGRRTKSQYT